MLLRLRKGSMKNSSRTLVVVLTVGLVLYTLISTGCASGSIASLTNKPEPTPVVTPTISPSPTPKIEATPTPYPIEEQMKKLISADYDPDQYHVDLSRVVVFRYAVDGVEKCVFTIPDFTETGGEMHISDMFSGYSVIYISQENFMSMDFYGQKLDFNPNDYTVYPKEYQGKQFELLSATIFEAYLSMLYLEDNSDNKAKQDAIQMFMLNQNDASLGMYAHLYLNVLSDSERVFLDELKPSEE